MEALLDIAAGTGVILFLLVLASVERPWRRCLAVAAVAAVVWAWYPIAVRQSLPAFLGRLDAPAVQMLAAVLALDGVLGCAGVTLLLRERHHGRARRWLRRLAAYHVGVIPAPALFYLEMKAFDAVSVWPFAATALALCGAVFVVGLAGSASIRRLLPDRDLRAELRLLVHAGQVVLAAGLTAFALRGDVEGAAGMEVGPHAVVAGAILAGVLIGYWSHRRRLRRAPDTSPWNC